jgi:hypothetical protein
MLVLSTLGLGLAEGFHHHAAVQRCHDTPGFEQPRGAEAPAHPCPVCRASQGGSAAPDARPLAALRPTACAAVLAIAPRRSSDPRPGGASPRSPPPPPARSA